MCEMMLDIDDPDLNSFGIMSAGQYDLLADADVRSSQAQMFKASEAAAQGIAEHIGYRGRTILGGYPVRPR
jgi:hypothetical protein